MGVGEITVTLVDAPWTVSDISFETGVVEQTSIAMVREEKPPPDNSNR
jgi:hypothetical protein